MNDSSGKQCLQKQNQSKIKGTRPICPAIRLKSPPPDLLPSPERQIQLPEIGAADDYPSQLSVLSRLALTHEILCRAGSPEVESLVSLRTCFARPVQVTSLFSLNKPMGTAEACSQTSTSDWWMMGARCRCSAIMYLGSCPAIGHPRATSASDSVCIAPLRPRTTARCIRGQVLR